MTAVLGLDDRLAELAAGGGSLAIALAVALLLGIRHATDPDHLAALSTLVLAGEERGARRAGRLGLAWGGGHAVTLLALGLPVVLLGDGLPGWAQRAAEGLIGILIVVLAVRLLRRRRRGGFGARPTEPGGRQDGALGRSPSAAFGIGLVHGAGGSAGVGILLVAGIDADAEAVAALGLFAAGTAASMAVVSAAWGRLIASRVVERRIAILAPAFGTAGLAFGCWYGLGAVG